MSTRRVVPDAPTDRTPSLLWLWGFWAYVGAAVAAFVLAVLLPSLAQLLKAATGVLLFLAGRHQLRVARYKRATRGPYTIWGFDAYQTDRQTAWTAMVTGVMFIAAAALGL